MTLDDKNRDFFAFFLPGELPDRSSAIAAVVAGTVATSLIALFFGSIVLVLLIRDGMRSPTIGSFLVTTALLSLTAFGIWKRMLAAAIFGFIAGIAAIGWIFLHGDIVVSLLLSIPLIGGCWTAARGTLKLKVLPSIGAR